MAIDESIWDKAKSLYELGIPYSEITKATGIPKGTISKKVIKEKWQKETDKIGIKDDVVAFEKEKETFEVKKETIIKEVSKLDDYQITVLDKIIEKEIGRQSIVFNTATLSLIRKNQMLERNKKTITLKSKITDKETGDYTELIEFMEVPLNANDYKTLDEGIDKNAITLEVAPRHAPKIEVKTGDEYTQNNLTINDISTAIADGLPN